MTFNSKSRDGNQTKSYLSARAGGKIRSVCGRVEASLIYQKKKKKCHE